jgi:invasion protein IalB
MTHSALPRAMLAALLAVTVSATAAMAQEKKAAPAAAPAAKPAAAAPAAAGAAPAASAPAGKQSAWVKLCEKATMTKKGEGKDAKEVKEEKNICLTHHERLDGNTGMVIVSAAIREIEGNDKKQFMIMVPLGMALPPGMKAAVYSKEMWDKAAKNEPVDEKALKPVELKFSLCHSAGCTAEVEATKEIVDSMKSGGGLMVLALNAGAQPIGFPIPLDGFPEAYGGKPVDNVEYSKARQELMGRIRQHQISQMEAYKQEQMKNLPPPPAGGAAPAPAAPAAAAAAPATPEKKK